MNIKTDSISGYLKWVNLEDVKIEIIKDYVWNVIELDDEFYLIDASMASDLKNYYLSVFIYLYIWADPEIFILLHFPNENKWYLLLKPYTFERFESFVLLNPFFYLFGFKKISPDVIQLNENGKIILSFDKPIPAYQIENGDIYGDDLEIASDDMSDGESNGIIETINYLEFNKCLITYIKFSYNFMDYPVIQMVYYRTNYSNSSPLNSYKITKSSINIFKSKKIKKFLRFLKEK